MNAFLGLPFCIGDQLAGTVGIANRPGGYDEELVDYLQPFLATCANIIGACRNNMRRLAVEEELRKSERKLRDIASSLGEGVLVLDRQGRLVFMNPEAEPPDGRNPS